MSNFALKILQSLDKEKSVTVSPHSISCALALCALGATQKQIYDVIAESLTSAEIDRKFFHDNLASNSDIKIVNTLYLSNAISLLESYKEDVKNVCNGSYEVVDFSNAVETAEKINNFVADATNQKIKKMVEAKNFSPKTMLTIVNAIYLEKLWLHPLTLSYSKIDFYSDAEKCEQISFLKAKKTHFRHFSTSDYQVLELPYNDQTFSMILILPHERYGLSETLSSLDIEKVLQNISSVEKGFGNICIPQFNIESTFDLTEVLKNLGITNAFDQSNADFSKMCHQNISVSSIMHKS